VPTDLGYRYFIESLMPDPDLRPEERVTVSHQFRQAPTDTTERLRLAASTLARLTAEAALATFDPEGGDDASAMWTREIFYEGIDRILQQPEADVREHVREVVTLFHDRALLAQILPRSLDQGDVAVAIGGEIAMEPLRSFSFVIGKYGRSDGAAGYVGIVGPRRMDYQRTIGAVRYVGELMSDLVRNFRSH
jgi:transcriptional regulator of heat shock response